MPEKEDLYLSSDSGVDAVGEIVGLMFMHVGDPLLTADDRTQAMAGTVLDTRFGYLKHCPPPLTHCVPCVSEDKRSLRSDQGRYALDMDPLVCAKNLPGRFFADEGTLDRSRRTPMRALWIVVGIHLDSSRM